jgi:hypothetical protein
MSVANRRSYLRQDGPHNPTGLPKVTLEIVRGRARNLVRLVNVPVFLIGSSSDSDLVLGDLQFPETYAYVFVRAEGVSIRYLGEGPALAVNGAPAAATELSDGDKLTFGTYEFLVRVQQPEQLGDGSSRRRSRLRTLRASETHIDDEGADEVFALLQQVRSRLRDMPPLRVVRTDPAHRPLTPSVPRRASA